MKINALFIHHSTGGNLIKQGKLRKYLYDLSESIEFWDHSYNLYKYFPKVFSKFTHHTGLSDPEGRVTGIDYQIHLNNNNPVDYASIFSKNSEKDNTIRNILKYDVILFKKCFPTSQIKTDEQLKSYKESYLKIRKFVDKNPSRLFIVVTQPPLRRYVTNKKNANRARQLANYLNSEEFIGNRRNLRCFDFFGLLTDQDNMLKREYCPWFPRDSHPNKKANQDIASRFAEFIVKSIDDFYDNLR